MIDGTGKLGITACKAVLAEDGTEIEEEYLDIIDQKSVIMLLEKQEKWTDQGKQSRIIV